MQPFRIDRTERRPERWCSVLSTRAHRACDTQNCSCACHRLVHQANYEKNSVSKVKRIG